MPEPGIIALSRDRSTAITDDGRPVPIAAWLDAGCEDCAPGKAVWCLVGPIPGAREPWHTVPVETLDAVRH